MKKTTYILLGVLVAAFIMIIISPFVFKLFVKDYQATIDELNIGNKIVKKEYQDIKAIKLKNIGDITPFINYSTKIIPSNGEDKKTTITLPDYEYFNSYKSGDTLVVTVNIKYDGNQIYTTNVKEININISTTNELNYFTSDNSFMTDINGFKGDSITLQANNNRLTLNKSQYRAVNFNGGYSSFTAIESRIDSLYIDVDNYISWKFEKCKIDTEFITGSRYVNNHYSEDECKRIVWIPKSKDAKFVVDTKAIITPCK